MTDKPVLTVLMVNKGRLDNCLRAFSSFQEAAKQVGSIQIVVADYDNAVPVMSDKFTDIAVVPMGGEFSRGRGINTVAEFIAADTVLICDADCVVGASAITAAKQALSEAGSVFPVVAMLNVGGEFDHWCERGYGISFHTRQRLREFVVPEYYSWGGEDDVLYERIKKRYGAPPRYNEPDIQHVWHPPTARHEHYRGTPHEDHRARQAYVPILEFHAAHACNLSCPHCAHYSNFKMPGIVSLEEARQNFARWAGRLDVRQFALLGGEPTLNPALCDIAKLAVNAFNPYEGIIVSNGFYLHKHPDLPRMMCDYNYRLELSQHGVEPEYLEQFNAGVAIARQWQREYPKLVVNVRPCHTNWVAMYDMGADGKARPVQESGDAKAAWNCCKQKYCMPLFQERLWKCPALAYFPHLDKKLKLHDIAEWDLFRQYQSLSSQATNAEIRAFVASQAIPQCSLCPSKEIRVPHTSGINLKV